MVDNSAESRWTWIMLAILLIAGVLTGLAGLGITSLTTQGQLATGSQTMPSK